MYRAVAVTQRDGSPLANSNCRMASIAAGLDFDTLGKQRSTGAQMRARQYDQEGGTDSGDAVTAWMTYTQTLRVRDGSTFDQALADLRAGRLVHLDVWHATLGGPCLSGSGGYGHTVAVAPEKNGSRWLVSDPWCNPPKWVWWEEAKLRAGAEEWGRRVYNGGTGGAPAIEEWDLATLLLVWAFARYHLRKFHAGGAEDPTPAPKDTGGAQPILFTITDAHPEATTMPAVQLTMVAPYSGTAKVVGTGHSWIRVWDGFFGAAGDGFQKPVFYKAKLKVPITAPGGAVLPVGTPVVGIGDDEAIFLEKDVVLTPASAEFVPLDLYVKKGA